MTIGNKIKTLREDNGISQTELANKIGISKQTLYKYEKEIITNIPISNIEKISNALNTTTSYLMGWDETKENKPTITDNDVKVALFGGDGEVTDEMWDEVKKFAEYVKSKNESNK